LIDRELIRERLAKEVLDDGYPDEVRSVLLYQNGQLSELSGEETAEALRNYLMALKLEDGLQLPVFSTASILESAASYERLCKLLLMAMERTTGRIQALARLLLAEHIEAAPETEHDRLSLLERVSGTEHDAVLALSLLEWEHLRAHDETARANVLARWIAASPEGPMGSQLRLELARLRVDTGEEAELAELLADALGAGAAVFPTVPEAIRLGLAAGDPLATASLLLEQAAALAAQPAAEPAALAARFILSPPEDGGEAAGRLMLTAHEILSARPESGRDEAIVRAMDGLIASVPPQTLLGCGLDGTIIEHLIATTGTEELERYLEATADPASSTQRAWSLWNRARAALAAGDFDSVAEKLGAIRELGMHSRVLDALESLGGASPDGERGAAPGDDPVHAMMDLDAAWAEHGDTAGLARELAGWQEAGPDVADLTFAAARAAGDSFLAEHALRTWSDAGGPLADLAVAQAVRLYGFEHPDPQKLADFLGTGGISPAVDTYAVLAALSRPDGGRATGELRPRLEAAAARLLGDGGDRAADVIGFVEGEAAKEDAELSSGSALDTHRLLAAARAGAGDGAAARWLAARGASRQQVEVAGVVATRLLAAGAALDATLEERVRELMDPESGLDAATRLVLAARSGRTERAADAIIELAADLEPGRLRSAVRLLEALGLLVSSVDVDAALDAATAALEDDPSSLEAVFVFAFLAPAAGRFEDMSAALERLVQASESGDPYAVAWRRELALLALMTDGTMGGALSHAEAVLQERGGDPLGLAVRMAAAGSERDIEGFTRELSRLALWFGDPALKGMLAHHQLQLESVAGSGPRVAGRPVAPDVANLTHWVATAALNGPVDLTDSGVDAALSQVRATRAEAHRIRGLVELAELVEDAGQPVRALELFVSVLDEQPLEPLALEGVLRLAPELDEPAALARACEARASLTADTSRAVKLLLRAADAYSRDPAASREAARCYQKAADLDPSDPRSFTGLVRAMELRGDVEGLIELLERRVASTVDTEEIESLQLKLADLKRRTKDHEGALIALDDLLLVQPGKLTAWKMKLDLLLQMQRFTEALASADELLERLRDRSSRVAVLQKCISVSLTKIQDLEAGLKYCLALVKEGDASQDLVNKTMRLALRLERWDEAAALQDELAAAAESPRERAAMMLKKAEIHMRYAKDAAAAEQVYKDVLSEAPRTWEALARWNAARGGDGLSLEEAEPHLERVKEMLEEDPADPRSLRFLVKGYRLLRQPAAARHFDVLLKLLEKQDEQAAQTPARPSLTGMLPALPSGRMPSEERDELFGACEQGGLVVGILSNLAQGGALTLLEEHGLLPAAPETRDVESTIPFARQISAWAEALGIERLELRAADDLERGVRVLDESRLVLDAALGQVPGEQVQFTMGSDLGALALGVPMAAMMDAERLAELVKAALMAADRDAGPLRPEESTADLAARIRDGCTAGCISRVASLAEVAPSSDREALERGVRLLESGLARAGLLVSGSLWGMLAARHPSLAGREEVPPEEIHEFIEADELAREGMRFLVSRRFGELRRELGLEY
jgi:tetratricopeptide (TPR) repeat protein